MQVGIPTETAAKRPCYEVSHGPKRSLKDAAPTAATSLGRSLGLRTAVHVRRDTSRDILGTEPRCSQDTGRDPPKFRTRAGHGGSGRSKGLATCIANPLIFMAPRPGLEPGTYGLTASILAPRRPTIGVHRSGHDDERSWYRHLALGYRLRPLERSPDTVIALQNMPLSHFNRRPEPSSREIESKVRLGARSNVTVNLSVSGRFEARARRAFPRRSARLLTIEWE